MRPSHAAIGLAAVLSTLAVLWGVSEWRQRSGSQAEAQAHVAQGVANAHQTQAQASDKVVEDLKAKLAGQASDLGRLNAERAVLLRKLASIPKPGADTAGGSHVGADPVEPSGNSGELELLRATVVKDAEVIESQAKTINSQTGVISELTLSRDSWKTTAEARERQALAQEAATKAWRGAVTTSRWRGRIEGFAAGIAVGYVGGRR